MDRSISDCIHLLPIQRATVRIALVLLSATAMGCDPAPGTSDPAGASAQPATTASPVTTRWPELKVVTKLIEWVPAPEGELSGVVQREAERAKKDGRTLLVYVGATWCEPCRRFHDAAEAGQIQGGLPPLRMLELDLDRDGERLAAAGYESRMIPLFAVPGPDGRGTHMRMEGSVKGPGAVSNIVPRLSALLAQAGGS